MSDRVLVIGFDGFDREVVEQHLDQLPTLRRLMKRSPAIPTQSTFPPDSTTAWATIYTGQNPGQHGVVEFDDPLEKVSKLNRIEQTAKDLPGRTFWDIAGAAGKRVVVCFPHLGHPAWSVNGKMFGRSTLHDETSAHPPGCCDADELQTLNVIKRFPGKGAESSRFLQDAEALVEREFRFAQSLSMSESWDLFFFYSSTIDLVEHFFWPQENEHLDGPILDFYKLYDRLLGQLIAPYEGSSTIVIVSDHGHGLRPRRIVKINEILRRAGLLQAPSGRDGVRARLIKPLQRTAVWAVTTLRLENLARKVLKSAPASRRVFTNPVYVDVANSKAFLSDFSGVKAYCYGGIRLSPNLSNAEREAVAETVVRELSKVHADGRPAFEWVARREDVVRGPHASVYPELLFLLREKFGAGREVHGDVLKDGPRRQLVPGSHRIGTPLFIVDSPEDIQRRSASLQDVAPTILQSLGVETPTFVEGTGLVRRQ